MLTRGVIKDILIQNLSIKSLDYKNPRHVVIDGMDKAVDAIMRADTSRGLSLLQKPQIKCKICKGMVNTRTAHHAGDGWALWWSCQCEETIDEMDWPFDDKWVGRDTLERAGFEIV